VFETELSALSEQILERLPSLGAPAPERVEWIPVPFHGRWGFGTTACFQAAAAEARAGKGIRVPERAEALARELASQLKPPFGVTRLEAEKAYLNAFLDPAIFASRVVETCLRQGKDFGRGEPKPERVMVEYAQPNTHHSFHIGHARNALLGESLARLVEFAGFPTIRASYPGDIGLGVITCMWAYQRFHRGEEPQGVHARGQWMLKIYSEATTLLTPREGETAEQAAQREAHEAERREMYRLWDAGDPSVRELWCVTRQWSLDELSEILSLLDIKIDVFFYESEADEPAKAIVEDLIRAGVAEDERPSGPVIVRIDEKLGLKQEKYRTAVVLRSDGTSLYLTKDLALAKQKFEQFHVDRSIYVVDVRQSLHFQQVFKILELMGFPQASKCYHLAYGFVSLPEGAMSARKGNVVLFMDVLEEAERRVLKVIAEKNPDLPQDQRGAVARQVGLGALAYALLSVDNTKDIVFNWDSALSFDGQTAPYIQNAHVRANSILRKAGSLPPQPEAYPPQDQLETELIDRISRFPAAVQQAATEYRPLHMASYAYELARAFHGFYHAVPVIQAEEPARSARLRLVAAARQTLANSLRLLDIAAPEVM
jgi:arginyl-tRNA synthetase